MEQIISEAAPYIFFSAAAIFGFYDSTRVIKMFSNELSWQAQTAGISSFVLLPFGYLFAAYDILLWAKSTAQAWC